MASFKSGSLRKRADSELPILLSRRGSRSGSGVTVRPRHLVPSLSEYEEGYRQGSPINFASQLEGKLLIVHGTGDDNVHYQGTERLINELVKHNRQFDLMSYPNRRHGIVEGDGTSLHLHTMQSNYFIEHLQGESNP